MGSDSCAHVAREGRADARWGLALQGGASVVSGQKWSPPQAPSAGVGSPSIPIDAPEGERLLPPTHPYPRVSCHQA
jgi:hypothetical protein